MENVYSQYPVDLHIGAIASADTGMKAAAVIPRRSKLVSVSVTDLGAFTASASVENNIDVRYIDTDGNSGSLATISFLTSGASGGTGNLVAGLPETSAGITIGSNPYVPENAVVNATLAKVGNGNSMTDVNVGLVFEPDPTNP